VEAHQLTVGAGNYELIHIYTYTYTYIHTYIPIYMYSVCALLPYPILYVYAPSGIQLRPKVEAHQLTVGAGNYELNRSLFERLVLGGAAHCTLELQHRMRPEISRIARLMTYPLLRDNEATQVY